MTDPTREPLDIRPHRESQGAAPLQDSVKSKRSRFAPKPVQKKQQDVGALRFSSSARSSSDVPEALRSLRRDQAAAAEQPRFAARQARYEGITLRKLGLQPDGTLGTDTNLAPRRGREEKAGTSRSQDLKDLVLLERGYPPISLPYYEKSAPDSDTPGKGDEENNKKARPKMSVVDEANANAAKQLFFAADGSLRQDSFFMMQMPSVLPELSDPQDELELSKGPCSDTGYLSRLPDGLIGKLKIHRSGKVRMEIGGLPFCVDQGCETFFQQDLACVCPEDKVGEVFDLGPINKRMVLTPDIDAMLSTDRSKHGSQP